MSRSIRDCFGEHLLKRLFAEFGIVAPEVDAHLSAHQRARVTKPLSNGDRCLQQQRERC